MEASCEHGARSKRLVVRASRFTDLETIATTQGKFLSTRITGPPIIRSASRFLDRVYAISLLLDWLASGELWLSFTLRVLEVLLPRHYTSKSSSLDIGRTPNWVIIADRCVCQSRIHKAFATLNISSSN